MVEAIPHIDPEDVEVLRAFSNGNGALRWREVILLLGLSDYQSLQQLLTTYDLPNPMDVSDPENGAPSNESLIAFLTTGQTGGEL